MLKNIVLYIIFVLTVISSIMACVDEEEVDFPDSGNENFTSSISLISLLNTLTGSDFSGTNSCFNFVYPIQLGYNNQSTITVEDTEGLSQVIASQSTFFNITSLVFPVQVVFAGQSSPQTITNEEALLGLLSTCGYNTLREDFEILFRQCFYLEYPVTLFDTIKQINTITSDITFDQFLIDQGSAYQLDFDFPTTLLVGQDSITNEISSVYELYEIIDGCKGCPGQDFTSIETDPGLFRFTTDPIVDALYFWSINGILAGDAASNVFNYNFFSGAAGDIPGGPGTYEICLLLQTPDCLEGEKVCKIIEVKSNCPEYVLDVIVDGSYFIRASGDVETPYVWFINDEPAEVDGGTNADNVLIRDFNIPGVYEICVGTQPSSGCPDGVRFCKEIVVEPNCPALEFTSRLVDPPFFYEFTADFLTISETVYQWTVNNEFPEIDGGPNGDNIFSYQFTGAGAYEVCMKTEPTVECPAGSEFCQTIFICPNPFFTFIQEGQGYFFEANFIDMNNLTYNWVFNNQTVGEGGGNPNNNSIFIPDVPAGDNTMCIRIAPYADCPEGVEFCQTFTVR